MTFRLVKGFCSYDFRGFPDPGKFPYLKNLYPHTAAQWLPAIAPLDRKVMKIMGGIEDWKDEIFTLEKESPAGQALKGRLPETNLLQNRFIRRRPPVLLLFRSGR